jgi:hypothetical protein
MNGVQINQGGYSQQSMDKQIACNSPTLVFTPLYLSNDTQSPDSPYVRNQNFGAQLSLSIPLDGSMVEICKARGKQALEKERLDMALVRIKECVAILKQGYMIRPESPYAAVCSDVVPIAAYQKSAPSSLSTSAPSLPRP